MEINRTRSRLAATLPALMTALLVMQPLLDIAGYWQDRLSIPNYATFAIRVLLLLLVLGTSFYLSDRKDLYLLMGAVMGVHALLHVVACLQSPNGYRYPLADLANLVRIYFLPLTTVCLVTWLKHNDRVFPAMLRGMVAALVIIFASQILSELTKTNPYTYAKYQIGLLGWVLWTNGQSAILSILCPLAISWALARWPRRVLPVALLTAVGEGALFLLAPRAAFASMLGAGFGSALCLLLIDRRRWKQALVIALITGAFLLAYPVSSTHQIRMEREAVNEYMNGRMDALDYQSIGGAESTAPAEEKPESSFPAASEAPTPTPEPVESENREPVIVNGVQLDAEDLDRMEEVYVINSLIWATIERFGRDRVFRAYGYTLDPTVLVNDRTAKLVFCRLLMEESGILSKLFGLNLKEMLYEYIEWTGEPTALVFDAENDFHGIYYLTGLVGLILIVMFLLWFWLRALIRVLRSPKQYFTVEMAGFAMAYGLAVIHAIFTACLLRRTNSSIYLAAVLAGLWYLSRSGKPVKPAQDAQISAERD